MGVSHDAIRLKKKILKAIEDHIITREEYEEIMAIALEDGIIDSQERALLAELNEMIETKMVKFARPPQKK